MRTDIPTLISALRILAVDIESQDGIANAVCAEAAERLEELLEFVCDQFCECFDDTARSCATKTMTATRLIAIGVNC